MKKKIIICVFSALILVTAIAFLAAAIDSYLYDMDPDNGVDILEGFGAVLIAGVGGFVVLYELDLFYTVYYFFVKPKTKTKTLLNIFSNLSLALGFACAYLVNDFWKYRKSEMIPIVLFLLYILFRFTYGLISSMQSAEET